MSKHVKPAPPGFKWIFRPYKRDPKTGDVMYARDYGLKAWPLLVPIKN